MEESDGQTNKAQKQTPIHEQVNRYVYKQTNKNTNPKKARASTGHAFKWPYGLAERLLVRVGVSVW